MKESIDEWYERVVKEGLSLDYRGKFVVMFLRKECYEYDDERLGVCLDLDDLNNIIEGFGKEV